jgi:hypothetical protein
MWSLRVSAFFTEITQQIHSLRASGVRSSHAIKTAEEDASALRTSFGVLWAGGLGMRLDIG